MKYIAFLIAIVIILLLGSFFNLFFDSRSPGTKIAHSIVKDLSKTYYCKYGLKIGGLGEENLRSDKYSGLSLDLYYTHILTKDQARALMLACIQDMLQAFNSHPEFAPYIENYPLTNDNIAISIYIRPNGFPDVYTPNIGSFSFYNDELRYTKYKETKNLSYDEESESYEEALKILEKQQKDNPQKYDYKKSKN